MIGKVRKILVFGLKTQVDEFFKKAQKEGVVEFISATKKISDHFLVKDYLFALKIFKKQMPIVKSECKKINPDEIVKQTIASHEELIKVKEDIKNLSDEITRVLPFGNFSKEDIAYLRQEGRRILQFFCIKTIKAKEVELAKELIYVDTQYDLDYYVAINKERKSYPDMIEIELIEPVGVLKEKLKQLQKKAQLLERQLRENSLYAELIRSTLYTRLNRHNLQNAKEGVNEHLNEALFTVEGWIAEKHIAVLDRMIQDLSISYEFIKVEEYEKVPTYMENTKLARVGEDLVNIYDTPSCEDNDPSMWILIFFAIFFAMIVSDMGYGLLYLLLGYYLKRKMTKAKPFMQRLIKLINVLGVSCVIWGAFCGSFFSFYPSLESSLNKFSGINYLILKKADYHLEQKDDVYQLWQKQYPEIEKAKDGRDFLLAAQEKSGKIKNFEAYDAFKRNIMMEFSLLIGAVHIILSFARYLKKNIVGIGWIFFITGGYLYFPKVVMATSVLNFLNILSKPLSYEIGEILLLGGLVLALLLAFIHKGIKGFGEIMHSIQIFADVLSYLRIYALSLAGMIMVETFIHMGINIGYGMQIILPLLAHVINFGLAIMGGVVHGLRLNFIEWYHYSFMGDGKLFSPLKILD
jgi:V/A-type H+-transporting ATPase subunit I